MVEVGIHSMNSTKEDYGTARRVQYAVFMVEKPSTQFVVMQKPCDWVYLGVRTCEVFPCFVTIMFVLSIVLTSLFSLFYVTREGDRFLHRG